MRFSRFSAGSMGPLFIAGVVLTSCSGDNVAVTGPERNSGAPMRMESLHAGGGWIEITLAEAMTLPDALPARLIGDRIFVPSPEAMPAPGKQSISPSEVIDTTISCIKGCGEYANDATAYNTCVKGCSAKPKDDH